LLNSMTCDGMMLGYDIELVRQITDSVRIPVIACGGAGTIHDFKRVLEEGGAHAAAAGSLFVFYGKQKAVLITAPDEKELTSAGVYNQAM
jgi:cyclase